MILKLCCYQERHKEGYGYIIYKWHNYEHHYTNKKTFQDFTEIDFFSCTQFSEKLSKHPIKPSRWEKILWSPALTPLLPVVFKPWSQESVGLQPSCKCFTLGNLEKQAPFQHMHRILCPQWKAIESIMEVQSPLPTYQGHVRSAYGSYLCIFRIITFFCMQHLAKKNIGHSTFQCRKPPIALWKSEFSFNYKKLSTHAFPMHRMHMTHNIYEIQFQIAGSNWTTFLKVL